METKIVSLGNGLAVQIPSDIAEVIGVREDSPVLLTVDGNTLTIQPIRSSLCARTRKPLSFYLDQLPDAAQQNEVPSGPLRGREII